MADTNFSSLSIESGISCGLIVTSGISLLGAGMISLRTVGAASSLATSELGIFQGASGTSIIYRSDDTIYTLGASAVSAAL